MKSEETIGLLEEVNEGIKMGISAVDGVIKKVGNAKLEEMLREYRGKYAALGDKAHEMLAALGEKTKEPPVLAKAMSAIKTNVILTADASDSAVAEIITDGSNLGVKTLAKYLNAHPDADERARDIAREMIDIGTDMVRHLRAYL